LEKFISNIDKKEEEPERPNGQEENLSTVLMAMGTHYPLTQRVFTH
jgi:hypothetical protein